MTDVTPNEARMPEDAAVTVTNADTLRAMASPIRMRILGTIAGEWRADRGKHQRAAWRGSRSHQLPLGAACACGTSEKGGVS